MWSIVGIMATGAIIIAIEVPALVRDKKRRELWVFFVFFVIAIALCLALSMGVQIPTPLTWLQIIYEPVSKALYHK